MAQKKMTYIPNHFRETDIQTLLEFMDSYGFATLISSSPESPVVSHIPVLVRRSGETTVIVGHVARANNHWRLMDGATPALAIFHGPHGYISPSWYETPPAVPTWNYGVVHAHGLPKANEDIPFSRGVLEELVTQYEGGRPDAWNVESLPEEYYDKMLRAIVAFEMPVTKLDGKFKLGQNRSIEDRQRTIAQLENEQSLEARMLAEFMRERAGV